MALSLGLCSDEIRRQSKPALVISNHDGSQRLINAAETRRQKAKSVSCPKSYRCVPLPAFLTFYDVTRPTITIDTSAVSNISPPQDIESDAVVLKALPNSPSTLQGEPSSPMTHHRAGNNPFNTSWSHHASHASHSSRI